MPLSGPDLARWALAHGFHSVSATQLICQVNGNLGVAITFRRLEFTVERLERIPPNAWNWPAGSTPRPMSVSTR